MFASHQWLTTPLPDLTSSNEPTFADCEGFSGSNDKAHYFALDSLGVTGTIRRTTCHQAPDLSTTTCVTETTIEINVTPKPSIAWVDSINSVTACAYETTTALAVVIDSANTASSPWTLTWVVTAENGAVSEIVQNVPVAQILANASFSLTLEEVISSCFNGDADQVTSFDVQVSALNGSGCESQVLNGSMTLYAAPEPTAIFEAICEGSCAAPINVNSTGALDFQWFLDADTCDGVELIPSDTEGVVCSTPFAWDLDGSGYVATSTAIDPEFCDVTCNSTVGMRVQQSWVLPTVADSLLQCTSPLVRFQLEVVPYPEIEITTSDALCDNLENITFFASNCNDAQLQVDENACLQCPPTSCESCFSEITSVRDWKYSINGGLTFQSQFPTPIMEVDTVVWPVDILTSGLNPILVSTTATTSSVDHPTLSCESTTIVEIDWHEALEIPTNGILMPPHLCPGVVEELDVLLTNPNGSNEQLCFQWEDCTGEASMLTLVPSGAPCSTPNCGSPQASGFRDGSLSLSVPVDVDTESMVCLDLTVTDNVGCSVDTNLTFEIHSLPSIDGIVISKAFDIAPSLIPVIPPCGTETTENALATLCAGDLLFQGDASTDFCSNSNFIISPTGVQGEFTNDISSMAFSWGVFDAESDPSLSNNLVSEASECGFGSTPELDCIADFVNDPAAMLSVQLTVSEIDACSAEYFWSDTIRVYPPPCIELSSSNEYCANEDPDLVVCGPNRLVYCCNDSLFQPTSDVDGCFDFTLPQACLNSDGFSAGPFYGENSYTTSNGGLTCGAQSTFPLVKRNLPPHQNVLVDDASGDLTDGIACEGDEFTLTLPDPTEGSLPSSLEWLSIGESDTSEVSNSFVLEWNATVPEEGDCETVHTDSGLVVVTYEYPGLLLCSDTSTWQVTTRPHPAFLVVSESNEACDGETIEFCATRTCGAAAEDLAEASWTWMSNPEWMESSNSNANDSICWTLDAVYGGVAGDGSFAVTENISLVDSYGCANDTMVEYLVHELPMVAIEAPFVCEGENVDVQVNGADQYDFVFDPESSIATSPAIFAPGDAVTGDSIQQVELLTPDSGSMLLVTGTLFYPSGNGSVLGCSVEDSISVVVYQTPTIEPSLDSEIPFCEVDSLTFCDLNEDSDWVPASYDYTTSVGGSTLGTPGKCFTFELLPPSTGLTVTKILNHELEGILTTCETALDTLVVVAPNPDIGLTSASAICQEDSSAVVCTIANPLTDMAYTHTWHVNDAGILSGVTPGEESAVTSLLVSSTTPETNGNPLDIQVWCEVADTLGCSSSDTVVIEVGATPILEWITPLPNEVCSPSQRCVDVGVANDLNPMPETLTLWANPNGGASNNCFLFQNNTPCPIVDDISATVQLVYVLADGGTQVCESSIEDSVVVNPTPSPAFLLETPQACFDSANAVCIGVIHDVEDYTICADDEYAYTWFVTPVAGLAADNIFIDDANVPIPEVCLDAPGTVELILEIENSYGCSQTTPAQPFTVRDLPDPTLTFTQPDGICMPTTVVINATSIGASDFIMSIEDYGTFENFNSPLVLPVEFPGYRNVEFEVSKTHTTSSILGYDSDGNPITESDVLVCSVDTTYQAAFEGVIPPTAAFSVLPGNTIDLSNGPVQFVNESEGQTQNIWIFGDGTESGSSEVNPQHQYLATGEYLAELAVVNDRGCTDYAEDVIRVREDLFMYVPNAFTPARGGESGFADNLNDSWFPSIEGTNVIESYEVCVFNRTGHRIWCSQDPDHPASEQWNGTGPEGTHLVQTGVYSWRITMKKKNGQGADVYTGHVNVIR